MAIPQQCRNQVSTIPSGLITDNNLSMDLHIQQSGGQVLYIGKDGKNMGYLCTTQFLLSGWGTEGLSFLKCSYSGRNFLMQLLFNRYHFMIIFFCSTVESWQHRQQVHSVPPDIFLWVYFPLMYISIPSRCALRHFQFQHSACLI